MMVVEIFLDVYGNDFYKFRINMSNLFRYNSNTYKME